MNARRMLRVALLTGVVAAILPAGPHGAQGAPVATSVPAPKAAGGAEGCAHSPQFDNKQLWPALTGKEPFVSQKWDKAPLYVWAHPGQTAMDRQGRQNATRRNRDPGPDREAPENWLVDGKPAAAIPADDEVVDLLLPASDTAYTISSPPWKARHVTIERGAGLVSPNKGEAMKSICGNLWIKAGGLTEMMSIAVVGGNHAFFRNDNRSDAVGGSTRGSGTYLCYWMTIAKPKGSLEFLGEFRLGDELKFNEGVTVVGPDTKLLAGPPSTQIIGPEAVLELQSGARFGKHSPTPVSQDIVVIGELRGGSPEFPLTKDAVLGLNAKTYNSGVNLEAALAKARGADTGVNRYGANSLTVRNQQGGSAPGIPDGYSLAVSPGAKIRVYSTDPAKARLRFQWNQVPMRNAAPGQQHHVNVYFFSDDVALDGAVFDDFFKGGIHVLNPALRGQWKHVVFGDHNEGKPDELFDVLKPGTTAEGHDTSRHQGD